MSMFAITSLVCGISSSFLAIFVLVAGRSKAQRLFAYFNSAVAIWGLSSFVVGISKTPELAIQAWRVGILAGLFISTLFYHLVLAVFDLRVNIILRLAYLQSLIFAGLTIFFPSTIVNELRTVFGIQYNSAPLVLSLGIAIFMVIVSLSFLTLLRVIASSEGAKQMQAKYFAFGFAFGFLGCISTLLPFFGVDIIYPVGNIGVAVYALILTYAISRHQLLDIRIVMKKAFVYSIAGGVISLIYLVIVVSVNQFTRFVGFQEGAMFEPTIDNAFLLRQHFIVYVVSCVTTLGLAAFVYLAGKRKETNFVFALYSLAIALWTGVGAFALTAPNAERALSLWRLSHVGIALIPVFFVHFVLSLLKDGRRNRYKNILTAIYMTGGIMVWADLRGYLLVLSEPVYYLRYYARANLSYITFFVIWMAIAGYGIYQLLWLRNKSDAENRNRLNYFCAATLLGYLGGITNFLPTFGICLPVLNPFANYAIPVYVAVSVYAIVAQRLIDIQIIIRKAFFYLLFAIVISLLYVTLIFGVYRIFMTNTEGMRIWANLLSVLAIAILFKPIEMLLLRVLDQRFFKGSISEISEQKDRLQEQLERRERLKAVGILASGMAHEIKNPLTAISTFVEYLPQKYDDPEFRESFQRILKAEVSHIKDIVQDLMDFSKPRPLNRESVELKKLIRDTVDLLSKDMMASKVTAHLDLPEESCGITGDRDRIKEALLNIILNAIEAMKSGGGELRIAISMEEKSFRISISDTGCGIPKGNISRIFDPFYTQKDDGTGLGLAITHSIIEQHKGRIEVQSEVGKGTRFDVYLPLHFD